MNFKFSSLIIYCFIGSLYAQTLNFEIDSVYKKEDSLRKLEQSKIKISSIRRMKFLEEGYIPQGIHVGSKSYYVSMYHKDAKGNVGQKASIVVEYSFSNELVRKISLSKNGQNYTGHLSGVGVVQDMILIPTSKKIYFFSLATGKYIKASTIRFNSLEEEYERVSLLNIHKDHLGKLILWTTEFRRKNHQNSKNYIFGYEINSDKMIISEKPKYRFYVDGEKIFDIQGITPILSTKSKYSFLVSSSYGDNDSRLIKIDYQYHEPYFYKYKYKGYKEVTKLPAGTEELHATGGGVWTLFESGAKYFQERDNGKWSSYLPYIIRMNKKDLLE